MSFEHDIQMALGTSNMVTASYVGTIFVNTILVLYIMLWFFKQPIRKKMLPNELAVGIFISILVMFNLGSLIQVIDYPSGYKPVAFFVQAFGLLAISVALLLFYGTFGILKLRDKMPGDDR